MIGSGRSLSYNVTVCPTRRLRPETWDEVAASDTEDDRGAALEQLGGYLDVVETQLLKEIAVRIRTPGLQLSRSVLQTLAG